MVTSGPSSDSAPSRPAAASASCTTNRRTSKSTIHGGKQRAVPDVAYNAAVLSRRTHLPGHPGGTSGWHVFRFGGTSAGSPQWAAILAIANQRGAGGRLGFLNSAIYQIGKVNKAYPATFHDIVDGTNSSLQFDSANNPVDITGFAASVGWDATTGFGSPIDTSLVDYLIRYVSPGDGNAAVATTKPKPHPKPIVPGCDEPALICWLGRSTTGPDSGPVFSRFISILR